MTEDIELTHADLFMGIQDLAKKMRELEARLRRLEAPQPMTGSIQGLEDEIIVTVPDGWFETITETVTQVPGEGGRTPPPEHSGDTFNARYPNLAWYSEMES